MVTCFETLRADFDPAWRLKDHTSRKRYVVTSSAERSEHTGKSWGGPLSANSWLEAPCAAIPQHNAFPDSGLEEGAGGFEGPKVASQ